MKKEDFIVGKWYKNLGYSNSWIGKFEVFEGSDIFWGSEWFNLNGSECTYDNGQININHDTCECLLSEIQEYLPDGHPDKIKPIDDLEPLLKLLKNIT